MSEQEFENYLLLLSRFLGLSKRQQESIANELRDHMEHRLDDLQSQGVSREEAIRTALEEFGDASHLAHELSNVARDRKRRWMMKVTTGSLAAAVMAVIGTMAFWPDDSNDSAFAPSNAHAEQTDDLASVGPNKDGLQTESRSDAVSFSHESLDASAALIRESLHQKCDFVFEDAPLTALAAFVRELIDRPVIIDVQSLEELGITPDVVISDCEMKQVRLETALRLAVNGVGLTTIIENESLVITTPDRADGRLTTRFYPVWDLVKPINPTASPSSHAVDTSPRARGVTADFDALIDIVTANISPDSWEDVGGEGSIQGYKGMLVVSNTDHVHDSIEKLVLQLRRFPLFSESLAADNLLVATLGEQAAEITQKLRSRTTVNFDNTTLADAIDFLKHQANVHIEFDRAALDDLGLVTDKPVSLIAKGVTIHSALSLVLHPIDLTYTVEDGYVWITSRDRAAGKLKTRCHDARGVVDLPAEFDADQLDTEFDTLSELIVATIAPDSWDDVGGEGSIAVFPRKGVIVCSNTREVHAEVDAFLNVSRKVRATSRHSAPKDPNSTARDTATTRVYIFQEHVKADAIASTIRELIDPDSWSDGAFTKVVQNRLIIRNSRQVHNRIRRLLAALRIDLENEPDGRNGGEGGGMGGGMF